MQVVIAKIWLEICDAAVAMRQIQQNSEPNHALVSEDCHQYC